MKNGFTQTISQSSYQRDKHHLAAELSELSLVELQIHDYFLLLHRPHLMPSNDLPAVSNNVNGDFFIYFFCKQGFLLCVSDFTKLSVSFIISLALKSVPDAQKAFSWERVLLPNIWMLKVFVKICFDALLEGLCDLVFYYYYYCVWATAEIRNHKE